MSDTLNVRQQGLLALIKEFLQERLDAKLEKLEKDLRKKESEDFDSKKAELLEQHEVSYWIKNAAKRAPQLRLVTHIVKAAHPDAKGTVLFCAPESLPKTACVSSHHLRSPVPDVVGNAAALDVYTFLTLAFEGVTILELMENGDNDLAAILSSDQAVARQWMSDFVSLKTAERTPSSHTNAKQIYWLVGDEPANDEHFHLLAPLYATSLTHHVYETIQKDKFGEEAKLARAARSAKEFSKLSLHDYPDLAVQKIGGANPQNISKLNSVRTGINYLLPSLPPVWQSRNLRPPYWVESIFDNLGRRKTVADLVDQLRLFLESEPPKNVETRNKRELLVFEIIDSVRFYVDSILTLEPGWSADDECHLQDAQKLWLDPKRAAYDEAFARARLVNDWKALVSEAFGGWLNHQLKQKLIFSDVEYRFWSDLFYEQNW